MTLFYAIEVDAYQPSGLAAPPPGDSWGGSPWGALTDTAAGVEVFDTIHASDLGYRTLPTDAGGVVVYPPYLNSAFAIDRRLNLSPDRAAAAAAWGALTLANTRNVWDTIAATENSDGRGVRIYVGTKGFDSARQYVTDPAKTSLTTLFIGIAQSWFLSDTELQIPIRDATYWLERTVQTTVYGGTGGLDGGADLAGLPKPKTRGSVRNVTPVLVDGLNRIYQWTDHSGTIQALYEGGYAGGITFQADVADLYTGSTSSGQYRTCKAKGLFQLGTAPVHPITVDAFGDFVTPASNSVTTVGALAKWLLLDDCALPSTSLDAASFINLDTLFSATGGFYTGTSPIDGATVLGQIIGSLGAKVFPKRDGTLSALLLRAIPSTTAAVATFTTANAMSLQPASLGAPLDPAPWRFQVGYGHNYTIQSSDLSASITAANKQFVAAADRFAVWQGNSVLLQYKRPSDPPQIPSILYNAADAQAVANGLGALWGVRRRLYNLAVPVSLGILLEIGDVVKVTWPMDDLAGGRVGQIVGEQFRAGDSTITFQVLV